MAHGLSLELPAIKAPEWRPSSGRTAPRPLISKKEWNRLRRRVEQAKLKVGPELSDNEKLVVQAVIKQKRERKQINRGQGPQLQEKTDVEPD